MLVQVNKLQKNHSTKKFIYYLKGEKEKKKKKNTIEISGIHILPKCQMPMESDPLCTPTAQTETSEATAITD